MNKHGTRIILPTATHNPHLPDWDRCAVKGCPSPRVLGSQACRLHKGRLVHHTCDDITAIPDPANPGEIR